MNLSFECVLDNSETRQLFRQHLQTALTVESLALIEAVEKYVQLKSDTNRFKHALEIVKTYITSNSVHEVNISDESKLALQATLVIVSPKDCPKTLFDKIVGDVVRDLKHDSFPRFLVSKALNSYMKEKESTLGTEKYKDFLAELSVFDPLLFPQHEKLNSISCTIEETSEAVTPAPVLDEYAHDFTGEELDTMIRLMKEPYQGIPVGDRKLNFKTHNKCFRASEIVTWLCSYLKVDRREAVQAFTTIQRRKRIFVRIDKKHDAESYKDSEKRLYRFRARKHIVLVGGGFANVIAARKLEEEYDVTLIDPKAEFECIPSFPLLISDPGRIEKIQYNYHASLQHTRIITDYVKHITSKRVYLAGKSQYGGNLIHRDDSTEAEEPLPYIEFDHLIIGTGAVRAERFKIIPKEENCAIVYPYEWRTIVDNHTSIRTAKRIVVVGGGAMGVEICSEILHYNDDVRVTMIVSGPSLLHLFDKSVAEACATKLAKFKNLTILTDSEVQSVEGRTIHYRNKLNQLVDFTEADAVMVCTGTRPNSDMLRKYMQPSLRTSDGAILVNKSFQICKGNNEYYANIFAVGDVTSINEVKLANLAMHHGKVITEVINAIESGVSMNKLPHYRALIEPLTVSFGPESALLVLNGKVIANNMIVREIKYKLETKVDFVLTRNKRFLAVV